MERTPATGSSWNALKQWGDNVVRIERLTGGVANDVWSVASMGILQLLDWAAGVTLISHGRPSSFNTLTVKV